MSLLRNSLLDLLPGKREGLHSAVLTTFSFNFYFFEKVMLRALRSIGVRNIVVLADAAMLHEATRFSSGFGTTRSNSYNLIPVDCGGAFHPKMFLLAGEKSGWLAVGSGNLTESGHGKNDEIWGAFYFSRANLSHQNLFGEVWDFVKILENSHLNGFAKKQIADTEHFAPWLGELPQLTAPTWSKTADGTGILLLRSGGDSPIWQQLFQSVSAGSEVRRITVFSPFYDVGGAILQKLNEHFPMATLRVVAEPIWGQLPLNLKKNVCDLTQFFDWKTLTQVSAEAKNRWLHAKIMVFETVSAGSFCLFGSSNATSAGFGIGGFNHELNLLLHSPELDFLEKLGLVIEPEAAVELASLEADCPVSKTNSQNGTAAFETLVSAAELDEQELRVFISKPLNKPVRLVLFDADGLQLQAVETTFEQAGAATFRFSGINLPFACQIFDLETNQPCSNRQVVVSLPVLRKTSPDPARAKWEVKFDKFREGDNQALIQILPLLDFEAPEPLNTRRERGLAITSESEDFSIKELAPDIELTEAEFTRIPDEYIYTSQSMHLDPSRDLADFLLQVRFSQSDTDDDTDNDEDEEPFDTESGEPKDEASITAVKESKPETTDNEAKAVKDFLGKYQKFLSKAVANYLKKTKNNLPGKPLTSRDLSLVLIALRLMVRYGDRKPTDSQQPFAIFPFQHGVIQKWEPRKIDSVQIACYEIIGKILLLLNAGIQTVQSKQEKNRLHALREAIFYDALFLFAVGLSENRDKDYLPLFFYNLFLHFKELMPIEKADLNLQLELRGKFGSGISAEILNKAVQDFQKFRGYFNAHFAEKDLKIGHRISAENHWYYLLARTFGVSLVKNKHYKPRYYPGGTFIKGEYHLYG